MRTGKDTEKDPINSQYAPSTVIKNHFSTKQQIAPKRATSPIQEKLKSNKSSCRDLDLYKPSSYTENTEKRMWNKQKHINVTVANQFTVHKHATKIFLQKGKTPTKKWCFSPTISPLSKNVGPCCFNEERPIFEEQLWQQLIQIFEKIWSIWFHWADSTYS